MSKAVNKFIRLAQVVIVICLVASNEVYTQEGKIKANGISIAYGSFGKENNDPIILIQGTGAPMTDWPVEFCSTLANKGFRVIRFDNRDIGRSTHLDSLGQPNWAAIGPLVGTCETAPLPYTIKDMATDVVGLLDALKMNKAHLVGVSMGGAIAQLVAIHYPERILTLTSISATSGNPQLPWGEESALKAMGTPPPTPNNKDSLVNHLVAIYKALGSTDNSQTLKEQALQHLNRSWYSEGGARQGAAILIGDRCDRREELAQLNLPVMVIHGDNDPLVPLEAGKEVANTVPDSEIRVIKGMGHHLSGEFQKEIAKYVIKNTEKTKLENKK